MAFPVLSTYRLQMRGRLRVHLRRRREAAGLPRRPRGVASVPVADPDRGRRVHARLRRHRPHHGVRRARRRRGAGPAVGGGAGPRHGPDRRHRAQPRRRRQARAEPVVVGRARARPRFAVRVILRHRLGPRPTAESCCRCWVPTTTSPTSRSTATCCGSATWRIPIAPGTGAGTGREVHDRQHYRLIGWRNGVCGYRRFFSITSLAGLRQEDRAVFDATHVEVRRWFAEGLVDGVRIDHPDGLSDPAGYLAWLREIAGPDAWIVIEKILAVDEPLEPTPARRRHHRLRRAARDRRAVRRSRGRRPADRAGRIRPVSTTTTMPAAGPRPQGPTPSPTRWPASWAGCAAPSSPRPASTTRSCPTRWPRCSATSTSTARDYPACPRCCPTALAETVAAQPELAAAAGDRRRGAGARRRAGGAAAAAVRRGHRQVDGGLPVLPRRPTGVAERGRRRARPVRGECRGVSPARRRPGPAVAARR